MRPKDIVLEQLAHRGTTPVPYSLWMEDDVRQRVDAWYGNDDWQERLTPYIVNTWAVDTTAFERIGDKHQRDAYGSVWRTDLRPSHLEKPVLCQPTLGGYDFPTPEAFKRPESKAEGNRVCENHSDSFVIGHSGWGLFERSWTLRGFENALMDMATAPDFYEEMLDRLTDLYLEFVDYTCEMPVDGILFGDDWGDQRGVIMGAERWRQFLKPRWARIYAAVRAKGKVVMSHSCGSVAEIIPDLIEIGLDVLESVQPEAANMAPAELKKKWGDKICFWGMLGSQSLIPHATPQEIHAEVNRLCSEIGSKGGYVMAPAKPIQPETPTENVVALIEAFTAQGA